MTVRAPRAVMAVVAALSLLGAAPGAAARDCAVDRAGWDDAALRLTVERIGGEDMLLIEGQVGPDLPARLKAVFADRPDISEIRFNSSGGDTESAMAAGRLIRSTANFATHVPAGWGCTNACALLFLSGRIRSVDPHGVFDMGRFYAPGDDATGPASVAARRSLAIVDYLIRMGVSRRLLDGVLDREAKIGGDAAAPTCLSPEELHRYNVANWNE